MSNLDYLYLRNRLPQNVSNEVDARELAKEIVMVEIPEYQELSDNTKKCIKHLTSGILYAFLEVYDPAERTLAHLYDWILKDKYKKVDTRHNQALAILNMAPQDDINNAKFHLCDSLMKYQICS